MFLVIPRRHLQRKPPTYLNNHVQQEQFPNIARTLKAFPDPHSGGLFFQASYLAHNGVQGSTVSARYVRQPKLAENLIERRV